MNTHDNMNTHDHMNTNANKSKPMNTHANKMQSLVNSVVSSYYIECRVYNEYLDENTTKVLIVKSREEAVELVRSLNEIIKDFGKPTFRDFRNKVDNKFSKSIQSVNSVNKGKLSAPEYTADMDMNEIMEDVLSTPSGMGQLTRVRLAVY